MIERAPATGTQASDRQRAAPAAPAASAAPAVSPALPAAPPVKPATWEWYIPIYFWLGGISAGSWIVAAWEDLAGRGDRRVIRAGRYLAIGGLLCGTGLLIADLGRPDRFQNMLRLVRARSAMSLGSWGLTLYGPFTGLGAVLQAGEDGWLRWLPRRGVPRFFTRLSRGAVGRTIHALGLVPALFVGSYTGVLLASTSTPSWARRTGLLGPLFLSSALSSGVAAVTALAEADGVLRPGARRRLARAEAVALGAELALSARSRAEARSLPSDVRRPALERRLGGLTVTAGMAAPLLAAIGRAVGFDEAWTSNRRRGRGRRHGRVRRHRSRRSTLDLVGSGLALAGSLALRYLVTQEGYRSAGTSEDTWTHTRNA